jgi:hypothetical protein
MIVSYNVRKQPACWIMNNFGRWGLIDAYSAPSTVITTFTQQQINDEQIQFIQDGGTVAPSYMVSVSDGIITTTPTAATVIFNAAPILVNNQLTVNQGQTIVLTSAMLNATDMNNTPAHLTYIITSLTHGKFILIDDPDTAITRFTQQQVNDGQVQFIHDGSAVAPSYMVSVSDGSITTTSIAASISFTKVSLSNVITPPTPVTISAPKVASRDVSRASRDVGSAVFFAYTNRTKENDVIKDDPKKIDGEQWKKTVNIRNKLLGR